jgi:hypothetical protein
MAKRKQVVAIHGFPSSGQTRSVVPGALQHEVMLRRPGTSWVQWVKRGSGSAAHRFTLRRAWNDIGERERP